MVDQICAMVKGFDEVGGCQGAVHQQRHTRVVRNGRHGGNIQHVHARVAHGFAKQQLGVGPNGRAPAVQVAGFDKRGVYAKAAQGVMQQVL